MKRVQEWSAGGFSGLDGGWFVLLIGFALSWQFHWLWVDRLPGLIGGVIPLAVPWAGAAGGVAISLVGVCRHGHDWDRRWNYWHLFRGLLGMLFGTLGVLIAVLVIGSVTGVDRTTGFSSLSPASQAFLAVISFVVGYRESTVRELITRVVDLVFTPVGGKSDDLGGQLATAKEVDFGTVPAGSPSIRTVGFTNHGAGPVTLTVVQVTRSEFTTLGVKPGSEGAMPVPREGRRDLGISFTPVAKEEVAAELVVLLGEDTVVVRLRGTGG